MPPKGEPQTRVIPLAGEGLSGALLYVAMSRGRDRNHTYVTTDPRTADMRPGAKPADLRGGADRLSVLTGCLENDETGSSALDTPRTELVRASHLAHLGAIWADLVGRAVAARCDAILCRELSTADYARYADVGARTVMHRQIRAAELAGHDPAYLLIRAVRLRPLDDTSGPGPR